VQKEYQASQTLSLCPEYDEHIISYALQFTYFNPHKTLYAPFLPLEILSDADSWQLQSIHLDSSRHSKTDQHTAAFHVNISTSTGLASIVS